MTENSESNLAKIGYIYHYPQVVHPTDKFRLDIYISANPGEQLFRVKHVKLPIKRNKGLIDRLTITHPWNFDKGADVCPGLVIVEDLSGDKVEAFTFGGVLKIDDQETHTLCSLISNAPIIEFAAAKPMRRLYFEELEILLAERSVNYPDRKDFEKRMCNADPFDLYMACLDALIQKFEDFPQKNDRYQQFLVYLHAQEHRIVTAGLSIQPAPDLEEIL